MPFDFMMFPDFREVHVWDIAKYTKKREGDVLLYLGKVPEWILIVGHHCFVCKITIANLDLELRDFQSYIQLLASSSRIVGSSIFNMHRCSGLTNDDVESFHNKLFNPS